MQETWVQFLRWEDSLEEEMANHSSILVWKIPRQRTLAGSVHRVTKGQTWLSMHALEYYTVGLVAYFIYNSMYMLIPLRKLPKEGNRASIQSYISQLCRYLNLSFDFHRNTLFSVFQDQNFSVSLDLVFTCSGLIYRNTLFEHWMLSVSSSFGLMC